MSSDTLELKRRLNVGQSAGIEHAAEAFRMPGEGGIHVIEQAFTHHKGFAGAAFFTRAAVETHGAGQALLLHPGLHRECPRQRGGAQQIVAAAVAVAVFHQRLRSGAAGLLAQSGECVVLAQQRDHRLAAAVAGDKRGFNAANAALKPKTFLLQRVGQQIGRIGFGKARLRVIPDAVAQCAELRLVLVNVLIDKRKQLRVTHALLPKVGRFSASDASVFTATAITCSLKSNFSLWCPALSSVPKIT
ncbi:hypothetical protein D3C73_817810 [compost metagenome]